jgi:diguanylate cyclase (GGDEF)-like protein/PAS domain S-box-containing protein
VRAALPGNEAERLRALERYHVLDTPREEAFDRLTRLAARIFDAPMALVTLIDEDRQWWKSCVGVDGEGTDRDVAFCSHAILSNEPLIIEDARLDPRFADNPFVTGEPGVCFYAGVPLATGDGFNLGAFCVVDTRPRQLSTDQLATLVDLARIVVDALELRLSARARSLFQQVCEMSPSLIYLYERVKHERVFLGQHLAKTLGYPGDRPLEELLPEIVHPQDLPRLYRYLGQLDVLEQGPVELSYRVRDASGQWRWYLAREALFERDEQGRVSHVVGIATDVTELKRTEQRLEDSEERLAERVRVLEGVLESAGEGVVVVDEDSRFTVFNPAARRIIGPGPEVGNRTGERRAYTLLDPVRLTPLPDDDLPLARALRGEPSDNLEMLVRRNDGVETLLRVTGRPLADAHGKPRGGIVTFNDITALRAAENELARRALTDALTGLPNRRAFDERLALLVAEGARGRAFALVLGDVDHFKKVNDSYGHSVGDEVLAHVGQVLRQSVRCTDFVARYGGEEFCVLFTDVDEDLAVRLADNLRLTLTRQACRVPVTCSFGVCANRANERTDGASLVRGADRALYAAKSQGRNRVVASQLTRGESVSMMQAIKVGA